MEKKEKKKTCSDYSRTGKVINWKSIIASAVTSVIVTILFRLLIGLL